MNIIGRFLAREDVVLGLDVFDKPGAIEELAVLLERHHHFRREIILSALWQREQIGPTVLPDGVAVPHAIVEGLNHPIVLLARTRIPITFGAPDRRTVSILFVIVVPEKANEQHLEILATISEMLSDDGFRRRLDSSHDASEVHRLVSEWNGSGQASPP